MTTRFRECVPRRGRLGWHILHLTTVSENGCVCSFENLLLVWKRGNGWLRKAETRCSRRENAEKINTHIWLCWGLIGRDIRDAWDACVCLVVMRFVWTNCEDVAIEWFEE